MTQDEIIDKDEVLKMARQAGLFEDCGDCQGMWAANNKQLESFTKLVADVAIAKEREACARVAADYGPSRPIVSEKPSSQIVGRWEGEQAASAGIEAAIRARGEA